MKYIKYLLIIASSMLAFAACSIDPAENTATPTVDYVRPAKASASDSLLSEASMGSVVAIIGENLSGVNEIWFNDQEASLNPAYITNTSIVVTVPGVMPGEVNDLITLKTKAGKSCTYSFSVIIPTPVVSTIDNDWAPAGTDVTISGNYFFGDASTVKVLFPGNVYGTISSVTTESITCTVPEGALGGTIFVTSIYGKGRSKFTFHDKGVWFVDFENPSVWNTWNYGAYVNDSHSISGQYLLFDGTGGSWAWPNGNLCFYYSNPVQQPVITEGAVADYALAFEYECDTWSDTPLILLFTNEANTFNVDSDDAQWHWTPYVNNGVYSTFTTNGKWLTKIVPLTEFNTDKPATGSRKIQSLNELININGIFFGANANGTDKAIKLRIDNLRIIRIK